MKRFLTRAEITLIALKAANDDRTERELLEARVASLAARMRRRSR